METPTTYDDLIYWIYQASHSPEMWPDILAALKQHLGSSHAFMMLRDGVSGMPAAFHESGFDDGHFEKYQAYYFDKDPWTAGLSQYRYGQFHASHKVCDDRQFITSEIYNDFARPAGFRHSIGYLNVTNTNNNMLEVAFMREEKRGVYDDPLVASATRLVRHIDRSLKLSMSLEAQSTLLSQQSTTIMDALQQPVLLLCKGKMIYSNPYFAENRHQFSFLFASHAEREKMHVRSDFIQSVEYIAASGHQEAQWPVRNPKVTLTIGHIPYQEMTAWGKETKLMTMVKLQPKNRSQNQNKNQIVASNSTKHGRLSREWLESYGALSGAEVDVLWLLCQGKSVNDIAQQRRTSVGTARQQVKSIMAKTGHASQLSLVSDIYQSFINR